MSQHDDAGNNRHDDAQGDEGNETVSLEEAQAAFQHVEQRRETRKYTVDGKTITFTYRALKADERDEVESIAASEANRADQRSRSGQTDDMDLWPVKRYQLQHGIVETNIEGFKPVREDHLKSLPSFVQDDLFQAIDQLGELDREVVDGFQGMG